MRIRIAARADVTELTSIALEAKRHWGYPEAWIQRWELELTITPEHVKRNPTYIAMESGGILGFCSICSERNGASLTHLWVRPAAMGRGVGRLLFNKAEEVARNAGAHHMKVVSDPNAEGFYRKMGATIVGYESASMDGKPRTLPLMKKLL